MLDRLNAVYPVRYTLMGVCVFGAGLGLLLWLTEGCSPWWFVACTALCGVGLRDMRQTKSAVRRNYPIIGNVRFML